MFGSKRERELQALVKALVWQRAAMTGEKQARFTEEFLRETGTWGLIENRNDGIVEVSVRMR